MVGAGSAGRAGSRPEGRGLSPRAAAARPGPLAGHRPVQAPRPGPAWPVGVRAGGSTGVAEGGHGLQS